MKYDWDCEDCRRQGRTTRVEVVRVMAESHVGPHDPCRRCGGTDWKRSWAASSISTVEPLIPGGRSEKQQFPLKLNKVKKKILLDERTGEVVRGGDGLPVVQYHDVVLKNINEYNEWMRLNNKVRLVDTEADSTIHEESSHSFFDQIDRPPEEIASDHEALARSNELMKDLFYVEGVDRIMNDDDIRRIPAIGAPEAVVQQEVRLSKMTTDESPLLRMAAQKGLTTNAA